MDRVTRVVLVRHAEPEGIEGVCYGSLDIPLSSRGKNQTVTVAEALSKLAVGAVYSSPVRRALETAGPIAARHGLEPIEEPRLREIDFGEFEGMRYEEIQERFPEIYGTWMRTPTEVRFPDGECYDDLASRALSAFASILEDAPDVVVVVSHGGINRAILASTLGLSRDAIFLVDQGFARLSVIDISEGWSIVRLVNAPAGGDPWEV